MIEDDVGVVLHVAPFTDSKKILTLFTPHSGRLKVVWRAGKKNTAVKIFTPCVFRWQGRGDMKTLLSFEEQRVPILAAGRALYCGMYLNEICTRVIPPYSAVEDVYEKYVETLEKLAQSENQNKLMEILLRRFEFSLLESLGVGINFHQCVDGASIDAADPANYRFVVEHGFVREFDERSSGSLYVFRGKDICSICCEDWNDSALKAAKKISRLALLPLIGERPLKSRELFT